MTEWFFSILNASDLLQKSIRVIDRNMKKDCTFGSEPKNSPLNKQRKKVLDKIGFRLK